MEKPKCFSKKNFCLSIIIILFIIIIFTPFLVRNISYINNQYIEFIILISSLFLIYFINSLYKKQEKFYEQQINSCIKDKKNLGEKLDNAFKYIGSINVQMQEIGAVFNSIKKYPETKQEIKKILKYLTEKALNIVNADWIVLRILDIEKIQTLAEVYHSRDEIPKVEINISTKDLINKTSFDDFSIIKSTEECFTINAYFILPKKISIEEKKLIEAIINQAEMLFIIFSSAYYKVKEEKEEKF